MAFYFDFRLRETSNEGSHEVPFGIKFEKFGQNEMRVRFSFPMYNTIHWSFQLLKGQNIVFVLKLYMSFVFYF